jgi:hypothetical protein
MIYSIDNFLGIMRSRTHRHGSYMVQQTENVQNKPVLSVILNPSHFNKVTDLEKIFLLLESADADSRNQQQNEYMSVLASALFIAYTEGKEAEGGNPGWAPDEQKAGFYLAKILTTASSESLVDNTLFWFAWLTSARLALLRVFREYWVLNSMDPTKYAFNFRNFQFSYLPEIVICLYKLFSHSCRPKKPMDKWYTIRFEWKRFWQILYDRKFFGILSNACVWLLVNVIGYCVAPWLSALINLAGFAFDIAHDFYITNQELKEYQELDEELCSEGQLVKNDNTNLLGKKIKELTFARNYATVVAIAIFIGMLLFYAPVLIPAAHAYFSLSTGWCAVTATLALKNLEPLKNILGIVGATLIIIFAIGWNFLKGKLKNLLDRDFYEKTWNFLKNNKIEGILPTVFFASVITLSFLGTLPIIPLYALMLCPPIIIFGVVKAISWLWQGKSHAHCDTLLVEEEPKDSSNTFDIIKNLKTLARQYKPDKPEDLAKEFRKAIKIWGELDNKKGETDALAVFTSKSGNSRSSNSDPMTEEPHNLTNRLIAGQSHS